MILQNYTTEELKAELKRRYDLAEVEEAKKKEYVLKFAEYIENRAKAYDFNLPPRSYDIYGFAKNLLAWLEKQGEQKPCMVQWKGDNLKEVIGFTGKYKNFEKWFKSFEEYEKYVHEHNDIFKLFNENGSHYEIPVGAWIVKTPDGYNIASDAILKQKSADNIEPKFKVGDWVASKGFNTGRIININDDKYEVEFFDGAKGFPHIDYVDRFFHLWTIEDAKDGDVLATSAGAFIYNGNNGGGSCPGSYCGINTLGSFQTGVKHHWTGKKVYPATKEQRDLLFTKMKEAGYEWDANKKELKKIEDEKKQDITERIKTFEDAYNELGNDHPFVRAFHGYVSHIHEHDMNDYDIIAYLKLRIITAALNEGWQPQFTIGEQRWYLWYNLITKDRYNKLSAEKKSRVVCRGGGHAGAYFGLVYAYADYASSTSNASDGSRLANKSKKLAEYAGRQFAEIYADFFSNQSRRRKVNEKLLKDGNDEN